MRAALIVLAGLAGGLSAAWMLDGALADEPTTTQPVTRPEPGYQDIEWIDVGPDDDAGKPGPRHSVIGQRLLTMTDFTCGRSGDELRFRFAAPARITGVDISVDINGSLSVVEVLASMYAEVGYEAENRSADPLLHTSWSRGDDDIDKTVMLAGGIDISSGEHITVGAWLCSVGVSGVVSPEVTIYYEWLN